ncbi:hypothetical protein EGI22_10300 [Lacihabitans sp. LS3-19]|uniref:hypothetical protein n=1 Tax=Lacihabitans sp. LS3-19 TaxID=2487335 RepID=UPI0020CE8C7B|nr:hypothetical protein [Lacihabitans sp. LS3-19]MCP9768304.1 hypothetical protein [Lacihabitans sp. LS3-19]
MKKSLLLLVCLFIGHIIFGQNLFLNKNIVIEQEYSYTSIPISESSKAQELEEKNLKIESQKQSSAQYYSLKQFEFKLSKGTSNLSIKTKRIKTKSADFEIDTDSPFASNENSKIASDHYLSLLENVTKINDVSSISKPDSNKGIILSAIPLLHPVYELSSVCIYHKSKMAVGETWQDTLENSDGRFVNIFEVLQNDGQKSKISLNGKLIPKEEKIIVEPYDSQKHMPGSGIEAKIKINFFEYKGELTLFNENNLIENMNLETKKDYSILTPFKETQRSNSFKILFKNKIK